MATLTLKLVRGGIQATCGCGLQLIVEPREVPAACPKCRSDWRSVAMETRRTRSAPMTGE